MTYFCKAGFIEVKGIKSKHYFNTTEAMDMNSDKLWEMVRDRSASRAAVHGVAESDMTGRLRNKNLKINM